MLKILKILHFIPEWMIPMIPEISMKPAQFFVRPSPSSRRRTSFRCSTNSSQCAKKRPSAFTATRCLGEDMLGPPQWVTSADYKTWLVVDLPLWKIWKSVGMMKFPIYGKIKLMCQTTNQKNYYTNIEHKLRKSYTYWWLKRSETNGLNLKKRCFSTSNLPGKRHEEKTVNSPKEKYGMDWNLVSSWLKGLWGNISASIYVKTR